MTWKPLVIVVLHRDKEQKVVRNTTRNSLLKNAELTSHLNVVSGLIDSFEKVPIVTRFSFLKFIP